MAYSESEIKSIVSRGKGPQLEFKTRPPDAGRLARLISAFANADGGVILIGVSDRGDFVGADPAESSRFFHAALARIGAILGLILGKLF